MKRLIISVLIAALKTVTEARSTDDDIRLCFLQAKFHHPPSGQCYEPLEQGPCADTQWLVPSPADRNVLECQQRPDTPSQSLILSSNGTVVEDSEDKNMFDIGDCEPTERLLPENFVIDTKPCTKNHQCTSNITVAYEVLEALVRENKVYENTLTEDHFKSMICSREPAERALCLPSDKTNPVTKENLYNSLQIPDLICMKNPCPKNQEPYQAEKGYFRCISILHQNSVTFSNSHPCPRRRIFRRGRCVLPFLG